VLKLVEDAAAEDQEEEVNDDVNGSSKRRMDANYPAAAEARRPARSWLQHQGRRRFQDLHEVLGKGGRQLGERVAICGGGQGGGGDPQSGWCGGGGGGAVRWRQWAPQS
jgi:hypothetical protein